MSPNAGHIHWKSILLYCILLWLFTQYHNKFAARKSRNDKMQRGLVSYNNDYQPSISNQQWNATWYHSVVDGMIILCSQWFAQLPNILLYVHVINCNEWNSQRIPRTTSFSQQIILFHDTYLHPSLIHNPPSLFQAMRTRFYRWVSGTKDDGDGLQDPPVLVKRSYFMMS